MFKLLNIVWTSFKMSLNELRNNKLRSFLSLLGITFGIFCIIGVLATVNSLESKIQTEIKSFGSNTIWIDKNDYSTNGQADRPWWKFVKRPSATYQEMLFLKKHIKQAENIAYFVPAAVRVEYQDNIMQGVSFYGITEDFSRIQDLKVIEGRYISDAEFEQGSPTCVIGYENATNLFGTAERAVGKLITVNGRKLTIVGLLEKQGTSLFQGFRFDVTILVAYKFYASIFDPKKAGQNLIMVKAKDGISSEALIDELKGYMRLIRKLKPTEEDNFTLNDIKLFGEAISKFFGLVNIAGWVIASLSLIVGAFGVANIMFVTVRERTSQIGLKKAVGAKRRTILTEFLIESALLCIMGGVIGLILVWLVAQLLSSALGFPVFIAPNIIVLALTVCVVLGILSGIIPASLAAKMNPVVAIRTK